MTATAGNERVILSWADPGEASITGYEYHQVAELAKLTASDGAADDLFGRSVAVDGDTMVVGAHQDDGPTNSGSAYVYVKPAGGDWSEASQVAKLTASDGAMSDFFGAAVSVGGDTIVVGASADDDNGIQSGSASVFVKPAAGWSSTTETAKLTASGGAAGDLFGTRVSVDGDTIVVGADLDDGNGEDSGSAYIFVRPIAGWVSATETAKLTASDRAVNDRFGDSVAVDGNTIVVGAYQDDGPTNSGSAYVFVKPSTGWETANETAKLRASDSSSHDAFGSSVSVDGDTIVVGAYLDDGPTNSGSAYVFVRPADGWETATEAAKLRASDGAANDEFGFSVSVDGGTIIVGAYSDNDGSVSNSGSAYVFVTSGWAQIVGSGTSTVEHTVTELDNGIKHTFGIRAVDSEGPGLVSASVRATPLGNSPAEFARDAVDRTVAENTAASQHIGAAVTATDVENDTLTYSLSGTDAGSFDFDASTGQLQTKATLDYETKSSYTVVVSVHDGKDADGNADSSIDDTITVTIRVTNEDEVPEVSGSASVSYGENGTGVVGAYSAADPEGAGISWGLSGRTMMTSASTTRGSCASRHRPTTRPRGMPTATTSTR